MDSISEQIRAKKNEIKRLNRELSKLQDEARANENDISVIFNSMLSDSKSRTVNFDFILSKKYYPKSEDVVRKISEILSDFVEINDDPKSYVDWDKIDKKYNWVAIDSNGCGGHGCIIATTNKPTLTDRGWDKLKDREWHKNWTLLSWSGEDSPVVIEPPAWDKSLIHRPGIKEN